MTTPNNLQSGMTFGGYEIVRLLGEGGYGAVYEAVRRSINKRVALKVLHAEHVRDQDMLERFLREAQIVAQVEHPHIVSVFDVGVQDEQPYIVMELLDGEALASRIDKGGPMPVDATIDLMLPVLSAMAAVHERGIVHRDLKPDNIFLARSATGGVTPKLLDFGIAKVKEGGRQLTMTRAIMGTPNYMSPEQARESKHVDAQSDQWALAMIVFECLIGRCPIEGETLLDVLTTITTAPPPRLRAYSQLFSEQLEAVLLRAMERAPADRWPSVRAFGAALLPFASIAAQAQWAAFFAGASAPVAAAPTSARAVTMDYAPPAGGPPPPAGTTLVAARKETLEPSTRPSGEPPSRSSRRTAPIIAASAALAFVVAGGGLLALRRRHDENAAPPAVHAVVQAPRAPAVPAVAPTVLAPVAPLVERAPTPDAGAPVAPSAAPALAARVDEPVPQEEHRGRHHGHGHGRHGSHHGDGAGSAAFPSF